MKTSSKYVESEEKSTGYKLKRVYDENAGCFISKTVQTMFQFIPITKTLSALFSDPVFEDVYMDYNSNKDHICVEGVYRNFCCGKIYRSNAFFESNKFVIQIRLFTDDFEICDPLKSKAGIYKVTALYFQINNLPPHLLSKTDNIYLVALSDASDAKNELADVENVTETVVADLKTLSWKEKYIERCSHVLLFSQFGWQRAVWLQCRIHGQLLLPYVQIKKTGMSTNGRRKSSIYSKYS